MPSLMNDSVNTYFCYYLWSMISNVLDVLISIVEACLLEASSMWYVLQMPNWIQSEDQQCEFVTGVAVELTQFKDSWLLFFIGDH